MYFINSSVAELPYLLISWGSREGWLLTPARPCSPLPGPAHPCHSPRLSCLDVYPSCRAKLNDLRDVNQPGRLSALHEFTAWFEEAKLKYSNSNGDSFNYFNKYVLGSYMPGSEDTATNSADQVLAFTDLVFQCVGHTKSDTGQCWGGGRLKGWWACYF